MPNPLDFLRNYICLLKLPFFASLSIFLALLFSGCREPESFSHSYEEIESREQIPLYRIKIPNGWERKEIESSFTVDTTKPICECLAYGTVRITIHNFPNSGIPPQAQIARWQQQFTSLIQTEIIPQAFSGFVGLKFEGGGLIGTQETFMIGWSLQLAPEFTSLCNSQTTADVTIKIIGPSCLIEAHKEELEKFARSFELIEELPYNPIST